MNTFTRIAAALTLAALTSTGALAASAISELDSAYSVSIQKVGGLSDNPLLSAGGVVMEQVDLDSLRARISQNSRVWKQLEAFGVALDDVIGITGSSESDLTIYVRG